MSTLGTLVSQLVEVAGSYIEALPLLAGALLWIVLSVVRK